jgi:hypothetical protein
MAPAAHPAHRPTPGNRPSFAGGFFSDSQFALNQGALTDGGRSGKFHLASRSRLAHRAAAVPLPTILAISHGLLLSEKRGEVVQAIFIQPGCSGFFQEGVWQGFP